MTLFVFFVELEMQLTVKTSKKLFNHGMENDMNTVFLDETELCERSIRRLADSRECTVIKDGNEYQILGAGIVGIPMTDDECWDVG